MEICPECGDKLIGRSDKKFCSDACRNSYNNRINKDSTNLMRSINHQLRKNYRILAELNTDGKTKVQKSKLTTLGFSFDYFTQFVVYKNGADYRYVYDQGYKYLDEDWILLVKNPIYNT